MPEQRPPGLPVHDLSQYEAALEQFLDQQGATAPGIQERKNPLAYSMWETLRSLSWDALNLNIVYLEAFPRIAKDPQTAGTYSGQWVRTVSRQVSGWLIATQLAATLCALLEGFMDEVGEAFVGSEVVARMRKRRTVPEADEQKAQERVRQWLRPSGKEGCSQWLGRVRDAFEVTVPPAVEACLASLIDTRNTFSHKRRPKKAAEFTVFDGSALKCWVLATWAIAWQVTSAVGLANRQPQESGA